MTVGGMGFIPERLLMMMMKDSNIICPSFGRVHDTVPACLAHDPITPYMPHDPVTPCLAHDLRTSCLAHDPVTPPP